MGVASDIKRAQGSDKTVAPDNAASQGAAEDQARIRKIVKIQSVVRSHQAQHKLRVMKMQKMHHEQAMEMIVEKHIRKESSVKIQSIFRRNSAKKLVNSKKRELQKMATLRDETAIKIQSIVRMHFGKQKAFQKAVHRRRREQAILSVLVKFDDKMYLERTRSGFAAVLAWRDLERQRRREASVMIQSIVRRRMAEQQVVKMKAVNASITIQRYTRGYCARRLARALRLERTLKEQTLASIKIQSIVRRNQAMALRQAVLAAQESERVAAEREKSSLRIQCVFRRHKAVKERWRRHDRAIARLHSCATKIQCIYRKRKLLQTPPDLCFNIQV